MKHVKKSRKTNICTSRSRVSNFGEIGKNDHFKTCPANTKNKSDIIPPPSSHLIRTLAIRNDRQKWLLVMLPENKFTFGVGDFKKTTKVHQPKFWIKENKKPNWNCIDQIKYLRIDIAGSIRMQKKLMVDQNRENWENWRFRQEFFFNGKGLFPSARETQTGRQGWYSTEMDQY